MALWTDNVRIFIMNGQGSIQGQDKEQALMGQLLASEIVDQEGLERARRLAESEGTRLWHTLPRLGLIAESKLTEAMSKAFGMKLVGSNDFPAQPLFGDEVSRRFLVEHQILPLSVEDDLVEVAVADPDCGYALGALEQALEKSVKPVLASPADIFAKLEEFYGGDRSAMDRISTDHASSEDRSPQLSSDDLDMLRDSASGAPAVKLVKMIVERAVLAGASDIHIEPFERSLAVRYRIDGVLQTVESPAAHMADAIVSRIKLVSNLNIAERRLPQDGRTEMAVRGLPVDMRVSTMPTLHGESVVLRILDRSNVKLDLAALGFVDEEREKIERLVRRPSGVILVVGPTGSGKTTTLYAALGTINVEDRKILTVEDPVEYQIRGISQTQVKPEIGLDFATVLRSALRQDPDIIMVGEIRDFETAEIVMQAALTGHTVFSTLHTNSAIATVTRLVDMGIEPYLLGATLGGVVAQRLVRCLCTECREPAKVERRILEPAGPARDAASGSVKIWRAKGCEACNGTGYRGRTAIYEILEVTDAVRHSLSHFRSESEIADVVAKTGFRSLYRSGIEKVLAGKTSLEEIMRVTIEK